MTMCGDTCGDGMKNEDMKGVEKKGRNDDERNDIPVIPAIYPIPAIPAIPGEMGMKVMTVWCDASASACVTRPKVTKLKAGPKLGKSRLRTSKTGPPSKAKTKAKNKTDKTNLISNYFVRRQPLDQMTGGNLQGKLEEKSDFLNELIRDEMTGIRLSKTYI